MLEESKDKVREAFTSFIRGFRNDEGQLTYLDAMRSLPTKGEHSLAVNFEDIVSYDKELASILDEQPESTLKILSEGGLLMLTEFDMEYAKRVQRLNVRIWNYSKRASIRGLNSSFIGTIVSISGVIVRSSEVMTQLKTGAFRCTSCQTVTPADQVGTLFTTPRACPVCNRSGPGSFELDPSLSTFEDFQSISLQERPEDLPAGQMPQTLDLGLTDDLVSTARPGDRVVVTGIVTVKQRPSGFGRSRSKVFELSLNANHIQVETEEQLEEELDEESMRSFRADASQPWHYKKLISSVAPSIHGLEPIKEAVLLQLAGGNPKTFKDGVKVRGDVNILLVGDPGTAKSQLLKYVQRIAPRGLYTSGRGATAAGLTAAAIRDESGAFSLEAGALVLADKGLAAIDEFEKMREEDRVAIHEAMEQQSYHPSLEMLLADGRRVRIGEYVDGLFKRHEREKIRGVNCEILQSPVSDEILSADVKTGFLRKLRISRVSRHTPPDTFVSITYSNGREILVTPEHPVYVYRGRRIVTVPATQLKRGDFVPAPRTTATEESIASSPLSMPQAGPREKEVSLPRVLTSDVASILGYLVTEGCFYRGSSCEIGFTNTDPRILSEMEGLMRNTFGVGYTRGVSSFGVPSQRYVSSRLYKWFELNFPELMQKARNKRAPSRLFCATDSAVKSFMRSAFLGDGSVESEAVCYRTASKGLAQDYQDLLLRMGVASRIVRDSSSDTFKTYITGDSLSHFMDETVDRNDGRINKVRDMVERGKNTNRHHDVIPADFAHLISDTYRKLGVGNDGRFNIHLSAGYGMTTNVARNTGFRLSDRINEIESNWNMASSVRDTRLATNWSQQRLANAMLVKRGNIDYCERGGYDGDVRLKMAQKARGVILSGLSEARRNVAELEAALKSNFRVLRIRAVRLVPNEGEYRTNWVYDVTVKPTHNFVSQGVLLHNTCSIAKAGIVATLNARTSILAAANPQFGRYDLNRNFAENVNLSPVVLSRFDLYFILRDVPDETRDALLTEHIIAQHRKMERQAEATYDTNYLRRYVAYAKLSSPKLSDEASEAIAKFFLELRKSSVDSAVQITPRQLESLIRQSEAKAKLMLRDVVTREDVEVVIKLFRSSLTQAGLDVETGKTDIDILMTGRPKSSWDKMNVIIKIAQDMEKEFGSANIEEVLRRAEERGVDKADGRRMITDLLRNGYFYSPDDLSLRKTR